MINELLTNNATAINGKHTIYRGLTATSFELPLQIHPQEVTD